MFIENRKDHFSALKSRRDFKNCIKVNNERLKEDIGKEERIKLEIENEICEKKIKELSMAIEDFLNGELSKLLMSPLLDINTKLYRNPMDGLNK